MAQTKWYAMPAEAVLKELETSANGLSRAEASRRLEKYGPNTLKEEKKISPWTILFGQFKNFLIILLIVATVISLMLGETLDAIVIFAIVIASALLGFYQEFRAEKARIPYFGASVKSDEPPSLPSTCACSVHGPVLRESRPRTPKNQG